ncbi:protein spaetzle 3-like [Chrysoperla carnea]|uniref:protein spaetzle 3-like n=1 Tax=Chrysoperla carnea TaxID=189513 RepID=UPI001D088718|nr:protein spaetzle 3-like [Chrysoperla carnea]
MALLNYSLPPFASNIPSTPSIPQYNNYHQQPSQLSHPNQPPILYPQIPVPNLGLPSPPSALNSRTNNPYNAYMQQYQQRTEKIEKQYQQNGGIQQQQQLPLPSQQQQRQNKPQSELLPPPIPPLQQQQPRAQQPVQLLTEKELQERQQSAYPNRPIEYKRIDPDSQKTSIHPIIDYDEYEYYDDDTGQPVPAPPKPPAPPIPPPLHVAPIQGPIFLKNGTVPVVPLYSYPILNNGTFVQIPIFWTALSIALGWELRGEIIRGVPCIKRYHQLFCPTAGNSYPIDRIELFIDENKALMKRMYGDFTMSPDTNPASKSPPSSQSSRKNKRSTRSVINTKHRQHGSMEHLNNNTMPLWAIDLYSDPIPDPVTFDQKRNDTNSQQQGTNSYFAKLRKARQSSPSSSSRPPQSAIPNFSQNQSKSNRVDACESKIEIVTPYWASNSAGKIRAIVNTQNFEQAIHQEVCKNMKTARCKDDCECEQKYKWHRLLAYDPDNDCKGIFMDWFLFPSCCVCRCNP